MTGSSVELVLRPSPIGTGAVSLIDPLLPVATVRFRGIEPIITVWFGRMKLVGDYHTHAAYCDNRREQSECNSQADDHLDPFRDPVLELPRSRLRARRDWSLVLLGSDFMGRLARGELFSQNWHPKVASLHALDDAELQHLHDFLHGGPCLQGIFDVTASAGCVHVGERCIERNAQELDFLRRHDAATV